MFIGKPRQQSKQLGAVDCGLCRKKTVNDVGLGDATQQEWGGQSTTGGMITKVAGMIAPPIQMIPGMSMVTKQLEKFGVSVNPMSLALAAMTGGMSMLPGISKLLGGMFKKATHMESCMKWWTDSNIRGMVAGRTPYPVDVIDPIIVMDRFVEASREYRLEHAKEAIEDVGVQSVLAGARSNINSILSTGTRKQKIGSAYVSQVRGYPDIMQAQCMSMPQGRAETGANIDPNMVGGVFEQMKDVAQQQEVEATTQAMNSAIEAAASGISGILAPYGRVASQKVEVIQMTREAGLVVGPRAFQLPVGVTGISKGGALVLTPGVSSNLVLTYTVGKPTRK